MKRFDKTIIATSAIALMAPISAATQEQQSESVELLSRWSYDPLYSDGWSVGNLLAMTDVVGASGEEVGNIENVIFSNDGEVLGVIAQVGGFWDLLDTHVHVPWNEVTLEDGIERMQIPVTEETIDDYDVFGDYAFDEQVIGAADTDATQPVDDDLVAGEGIFKATDLIGDYAYLSENVRYGYVADLIVQEGMISAVVTDAASYGNRGYYAYPYVYRSDMTQRYDLPYEPVEIDKLESFNYEQLQSRVTD